MLYRELGIADVEQLAQAVDEGRLAEVKGFGAKTEENIRRGIERMNQSTRPGARLAWRWTWPRTSSSGSEPARRATDRVRGFAAADGRDDRRRRPAGRERRPGRGHGRVHLGCGVTERVLASGDTKSSILTRKGLQVDLRVVPLEAWGAAMIYFTGSKAHNIRIREMAVRKGLKLNEYGLFRAKTRRAASSPRPRRRSTRRLGLPWIPPTLREDRGEVEAALEGELPHVLELQGAARRPAHAHEPHRRPGHARADARGRRRAEVRVLRRDRPRAEPVHAADDRREDARPAGAAPGAAVRRTRR